MDTSVDAELDRLISKRASEGRSSFADPDEQEELWKTSVRAHNARLRDENREAWCEYHRGQAERLRDSLARLVAFHEGAAERLEGGGR